MKMILSLVLLLSTAACGDELSPTEIVGLTNCKMAGYDLEQCRFVVDCARDFPEKAATSCRIPVLARTLLGGPEPTRDEIQAVLDRAMKHDRERVQ